MSDEAAVRWRHELAAWAIPAEILSAAPESPWGFPVEMWRVADETTDDTPSRQRAFEALPAGGSVLDVGCGGGRAGLALVPPAGSIVGVDESADMLAAFAATAADRGIVHDAVLGRWPDVAGAVGSADVVVCHHVAYNVADLGDFATALAARARRRVVLELTQVHPLVAMAPLWRRFHDLERPSGPSAELAADVLREADIEPVVEEFSLRTTPLSRELLVAFTRRRLCLPASRDAEVDEALGPDWNTNRALTTLWWEV